MKDRIVTLRMDEEMVEAIEEISKDEQRTLVGQIRHICDMYLKDRASPLPINTRS